jgi:hypothetical protein
LAARHNTQAALQASRERPDEYTRGYQDGYQSALIAFALSFGLAESAVRRVEPEGAARRLIQDKTQER